MSDTTHRLRPRADAAASTSDSRANTSLELPVVVSWDDEVAWRPSVAVVIPTLDESAHIEACLAAVDAQTYDRVTEVLVVDGGSTDDTVAIACRHDRVDVVNNPRRIQAAALNVALRVATAEVVVRVDGHCVIEPDYVERCVDALSAHGAALVGGAMRPVGEGARQRGIAAAMSSRWGAGPARFHIGGRPGWVDTVYLGAYRRADALAVGGYAEDVGVNEDAEFAIRVAERGGVWFEPTIRSTYAPRSSLRSLARQFFRYGSSRARTVRRHPGSFKPRQMASLLLVAGLASPARRTVAGAYLLGVVAATAADGPKDAPGRLAFAAALPIMHLSWAAGFLLGSAPRPHEP